jgi:hypothetical protein
MRPVLVRPRPRGEHRNWRVIGMDELCGHHVGPDHGRQWGAPPGRMAGYYFLVVAGRTFLANRFLTCMNTLEY